MTDRLINTAYISFWLLFSILCIYLLRRATGLRLLDVLRGIFAEARSLAIIKVDTGAVNLITVLLASFLLLSYFAFDKVKTFMLILVFATKQATAQADIGALFMSVGIILIGGLLSIAVVQMLRKPPR